MRISLLLEREPFGRILENTLTHFLSQYLAAKVSVAWHESLAAAKKSTTGQFWLCNPYLNAIFVPHVQRSVLLPIIEEYSMSRVWWLRALQKIYVEAALSLPLSCFLSPYGMRLTPPIENSQNCLIMGGNHHLRFHDLGRNKAYVIAKAGFDKSLMQNELQVRIEHSYLPCPLVLERSEDDSWYSEPLIVGTPLNRVKDKKKRKEAIRHLIASLFLLYERTIQWEDAVSYVNTLCVTIRRLSSKSKCIGSAEAELVLRNAAQAAQYVGRIGQRGIIKFPIAQTHGDFQPANILLGNDQSWLIDWEYTGRRHAAYDVLVFLLSSRFSHGLCKRINFFLAGNQQGTDVLLNKHPFIDWQELTNRKTLIAVFLLEELALRLQQDANSLFSHPSTGFHDFIDEMKHALAILEL